MTAIMIQQRAQGHGEALARLEAKKQVIAEVITGRLALLEASTRFQALSEGMHEPEQGCRAIIGWAQLALSDRPEKAEAICETLERELQRHLARKAEA